MTIPVWRLKQPSLDLGNILEYEYIYYYKTLKIIVLWIVFKCINENCQMND